MPHALVAQKYAYARPKYLAVAVLRENWNNLISHANRRDSDVPLSWKCVLKQEGIENILRI